MQLALFLCDIFTYVLFSFQNKNFEIDKTTKKIKKTEIKKTT